MASSSEATCQLCRHFYSDPRMLPCLHTFCYTCLCTTQSKTTEDLTCPTCCSSFHLSNTDISSLPQDLRKVFQVKIEEFGEKTSGHSSFNCDRCLNTSNNVAVTYCSLCHEFLCHHCKKDHRRCKQTAEHDLIKLSKEYRNKDMLQSMPHHAYCKSHSNEILKFYCVTCKQLSCSNGIILSHQRHKYDTVENIFEKEKIEVQGVLGKLEMSAAELESNISQGKTSLESINNQKEEVAKIIEGEFKKLQQAVLDCKKKLLARTNEVCRQKEVVSNYQQMSGLRSELQAVIAKVHEALDVYGPAEFMSIKSLILSRLDALRKKLTTISPKPYRADHLTITFNSATLLRDIEKYCSIGAGAYPKYCTTSLGLCIAIVGVEKNIEITTRNVNDDPITHGGEIITAELTKSGLKGGTVDCAVQDNKNGMYTVSVMPQSTGEHYLDIKIGNESIHCSPFILSVRLKREYKYLEILQVYNIAGIPHDITDSGKRLYVVHGNPSGISVIDKVAHTVETFNIESIQLQTGRGIAEWKGKLYVTDSDANCVYKLDCKDKKCITKIGSHGTGEGQLILPHGVCVDASGRIYVSEYGNQRISVFQYDGVFVKHIPVGEDRIWGVALDFHGNLHVVDHNSHGSITVFSPKGKRLQQYGKGQLQHPIGIAINPEQQVVVTEFGATSSRMFSLKPDFHTVTLFNNHIHPHGVCFDRDGYIYVCDSSNGRICKY